MYVIYLYQTVLTLGRVFEQLIEDNLFDAGKEERSLAIAQGMYLS